MFLSKEIHGRTSGAPSHVCITESPLLKIETSFSMLYYAGAMVINQDFVNSLMMMLSGSTYNQ